MYKIDPARVKKILVDEFQFRPALADEFMKKYPPIHDELAGAVESWLEDRTVLDVRIEGISIAEVMRNRRTNFLYAVSDLNKLLDPDMPKDKRGLWIEILKKPGIRM